MGYFDLADYPTCADSSYECNTRALGTISPDGKTLFFIGDANLIDLTMARLLLAFMPVFFLFFGDRTTMNALNPARRAGVGNNRLRFNISSLRSG